jgi:hypothetical protein
MKFCRNCLIEQPYNNFHKNKQTKDGYAAYCKPCKSEKDKIWVMSDPKRIQERKRRSKEWQTANPERYRESIKRWVENNPEQKWILDKKSHLWTHYRITIDQYQEMFLKQEGKCLICEKSKKLVVDHDHSCCSGKLTCGKCTRGLVCQGCNTLLGLIENNKGIIKKINKYLDIAV